MSELLLGRAPRAGWTSVTRGVHLAIHSTASPLLAWAEVVGPAGCFTGPTAAEVRGWEWAAPPPTPPFCVSVPLDVVVPRRPGLRVSRPLLVAPPTSVTGLRLASSGDTLLELGRDLGLLDLTVLVDQAVRAGDCTIPELQAFAGRRRRGAPMLRQALDLADPRAESPWETLLRILHLLCEVPVEAQFLVGRYRADLRINGTRRLPEYDGSGHRDAQTHARDLARDRALAAGGWERYGYTAGSLLLDAAGILHDADAALNRPHRPGRLRRWQRELAASVVTQSGRRRLAARWAPSVSERQLLPASACRAGVSAPNPTVVHH